MLAMALAAVVTLVCLEYLRTPEGLPRSQRLADGSVLTVESISIGTNHYYHEASPRDWQLAVGKRLPYTLAAGLGWCFDTSGEAISVSNPRMTSLVIFAKLEGSGTGASDTIRAVVLDEDGNSLGWNDGGGHVGTHDSKGTHYHQLRFWDIPAFPRRSKTLVVRFFQKQGDGNVDLPIMQFHIANPQPGTYPIWKPEPWPATEKAGNLTVTLTDFTTGLSKSDPTRAALENEEVVTKLALDLEAKGLSTFSGQVNLVEVSDASGNCWNAIPWRIKTKTFEQGLTETMYLPGNLWPGESAWKLRVALPSSFLVSPDVESRFVEFTARPQILSNTQ